MITKKLPITTKDILKVDKMETSLFIKTGGHEISAFLDMGDFPLNCNLHRFKGLIGGDILNFHPFDLYKLLVVTKDGFITIFQNLKNSIETAENYVFKLNLKKGEIVTASAICFRETFLSFATSIEEKAERLIVLNFDTNFNLMKRSEFSFKEKFQRKNFDYIQEISDISMEFYVDDYPIMLCFERKKGTSRLIPLILNSSLVEVFKGGFIDYHNGIVENCCFYQGYLWSVDNKGIIKKVDLDI